MKPSYLKRGFNTTIKTIIFVLVGVIKMFVYFLLTFLWLINFGVSACPNGTIAFYTDKSLCFSFQSNKTLFLEAEGICIGMGGHLTSINSMFENMFVSRELLEVVLNDLIKFVQSRPSKYLATVRIVTFGSVRRIW